MKNPTFGLRGPDQQALSTSAANAIGKIASGTSADIGLKQLIDDWNQIEMKTPFETRLKWRKMSVGLN